MLPLFFATKESKVKESRLKKLRKILLVLCIILSLEQRYQKESTHFNFWSSLATTLALSLKTSRDFPTLDFGVTLRGVV